MLVGLLLRLATLTGAAALTALPAVHGRHAAVSGVTRLRGGAPAMAASPAIAIVVDAEIVPDRVDEFLGVIEKDAKGSRDEPGCVRFDVLRASETRFLFYEAYVSDEAVDTHKAQPHFKLWSDFTTHIALALIGRYTPG